jgi:apolipoprotein N-acyltransferase
VRHADPELLINLTNDAWFLDTAEPWEHFALTQMRSVEHRRYLVRGTNSGVSGVVDPVGRVVAQSGTFRQEALLAPIRWMRAHTLYETIGDWPWVIVSAVGVILAFVRRGPPIRVSAPS